MHSDNNCILHNLCVRLGSEDFEDTLSYSGMCLSSRFFKVLFLFIYTKFDLVYMYMTVDLIVQFIDRKSVV